MTALAPCQLVSTAVGKHGYLAESAVDRYPPWRSAATQPPIEIREPVEGRPPAIH
jgi:hypothetical protein